jgi:UDP-N-acetylmuramoyl-tripeptide--D-alanyl-D-alanine ligase
LALPAIGVVTNVGPVHLERLGTIERIAEAKSELVQALPADGLAVLNGDDERVQAMAAVTPARVLYYGLGESCDVRAEDISLQGIEGSSFTLIAHGHSARVRLGLPGRHSVYNALAAAAVAFASGLSWDEVTASLAELRPGLRLVFVPGVNGSVIIDDTYNASPASTCAALDVLAQVPGRRAAILGDMLELGSQEEEGHREVGRRAAEVVHSLVVVGRRARWIAAEAQARGLREIAYFDTSREVEYHPRPGEHVLVKGSRSMSMEVVVEKLRAAEVGA